jgi:hypothetical protein
MRPSRTPQGGFVIDGAPVERGDAVANGLPWGLRSAAGSLAAGIGLVVLALQPPVAGASETDQFTLPVGREFADLRGYFSRTVHTANVGAVNEANAAGS